MPICTKTISAMFILRRIQEDKNNINSKKNPARQDFFDAKFFPFDFAAVQAAR